MYLVDVSTIYLNLIKKKLRIFLLKSMEFMKSFKLLISYFYISFFVNECEKILFLIKFNDR